MWYPNALRDPGQDAGPLIAGHPYKGLFHTTEGSSYAGARAAYASHKGWPHFTCTFEGEEFSCYQHIPTTLAARALQNFTGGHETNRDGCIQIELVGTADSRRPKGLLYVEDFPQGYLDGIKALMRWLEQTCGIKRTSNVTWLPYPKSYGANGVRLSMDQWHNYSGWLGHQHAPENSHGDPGLLKITYLLTIAQPQPPQEDEDMKLNLVKSNDSAGVYVTNWIDTLWLLKADDIKAMQGSNALASKDIVVLTRSAFDNLKTAAGQ